MIKWQKNKDIYIPNNKKLIFNQSQLEFINSSLIDLKLIGIPGGGKTRCIIEKIIQHFDKNDYNCDTNFLILSFSKRCRFDFINKGKIYPKRFNRNNVKTLHSLSQTIVNFFSDKNSSCLDTIIVAAKNIITKLDKDDLIKLSILSNLKSIYLDEAQDISDSQYNFIILLKKKLNCNLIMVGDPNQNIYQFQGGSDKYLLDYKADTIYLTQNYRSTRNIVTFVNSISPNKDNKMNSVISENNKINIFINNIDNIKQFIIDEINNYKGDLSEIAIIGPVRKSKPIMDNYLNIGLSYIVNLLESCDINYNKFFDDINDNVNIKIDNKIVLKPNHINLLTIHGSKGLEFNKVILLNFHFHTFGITPTLEDYNKFKYLWYVGCSRAKYDISILVLDNKLIWPLLEEVPIELYKINKIPKFNKLYFKSQPKQLNFGVTKILENIKPETLYLLEKKINFTYTYDQIYMTNPNNIVEYSEYSALYGIYIETIFKYFYTKKNYTIENNIFKKYLSNIQRGILVDKKYIKIIINIIKKLNFNLTDVFNLSMFNDYKNKFNNLEINAYNYLCTKIKHNLDEFTLIFENDVIINDSKTIIQICKKMIDDYDNNYKINIFKLVLYNYQINNELGYLWSKDFIKNINSLNFYIKNIENYINKLNTKMEFSIPTKHPNLPIIGEIDILENKDTIIDIKFTKNIHIKQIIQILLYYNNLFPDWSVSKKLKIFNFFQSRVYTINIDSSLTNYDLLKILCELTKQKMVNCLFVYDLETTSLDTNTCQIIERYFKEYNLNFIASNGIININNKISTEIEMLTGINNQMIQNGDRESKFRTEIDNIFKYCYQPKFIAHNGNMFDHKILLNQNIFKNIYKNQLLDSKNIIRLMFNSDNYKLQNLYFKIVKNQKIKNYHRAEVDVEMLIAILKEIKY